MELLDSFVTEAELEKDKREAKNPLFLQGVLDVVPKRGLEPR